MGSDAQFRADQGSGRGDHAGIQVERGGSGAGLRADRAAEVIVGLPGGGGRRGSGYLVATGRVLTAAHVIEGAATVRVRFDADRPGEWTADAFVEWQHAGTDTAVLAVPPSKVVGAMRFGRVGEHDAVLNCGLIGFPRFKLRRDTDGSSYRDSEHARATCAVFSNRREGTLDLSVTPPAPLPEADTAASPWEGMSGAVVHAGGRIVGVVARHHLSDGLGRLAARRVDRWEEHLSQDERRRLEAVLGCALTRDELPDVVPPSGPGLIEAAYQAQLQDIAPTQLLDREGDVRELVAFCAGPERYLWLQGPPWAGKTALAAWFAAHPPRGVVPVWFFITARFAGQASSTAYTDAVIDQLATIAGRQPSAGTSPAARDGERRLLLAEAAQRVEEDGDTLLLVVDGLDEDRSAAGGAPSIASLLPERMPANVRVLVTSRLGPGLPPDVPGIHPLRSCTVQRLSPVAAARHTEHEARFDLSVTLAADELPRKLVGLLAAAQGVLALKDLQELTGQTQFTLNQCLGGTFGRVVRMRRQSRYDEDAPRGYLFAHTTLLDSALRELGPDLEPHRERVHAWARRYAELGWPPGTSPYLMESYGLLLVDLAEVGRATALVTDVRRHDRLRETTGSDAAGLAEIELVRRAVLRAEPDGLGDVAALAVIQEFVANRNKFLHPGVAVARAALGQSQRAIGLARTVVDPAQRAHALAGVARELADTGHPHTKGLAREAVRLVEDAAEAMVLGHFDKAEVKRMAAVALMAVGEEGEARALLHKGLERPELSAYGEGAFWIEALAEAAVATHRRTPRRAQELLGEAEERAERMQDTKVRIQALAAVAAAYWTVNPEQAERLYGRLEALRDAVCAMVSVGVQDEVERSLEFARGPQRPAWPAVSFRRQLATAVDRARAGRVEAAWQALEQELRVAWDDRPRWAAAAVGEACAAGGFARRLESVVHALPDWHVGSETEALSAAARYLAHRDRDEAARLVDEAERMEARSRHLADRFVREPKLVHLAQALTAVGLYADAERLVAALQSNALRCKALAACSVAQSGVRPEAALRLAQEAADLAESLEFANAPSEAELLVPVAQALGHAGAGERGMTLAARIYDLRRRRLAHTAVAGGLWAHDSAAATRLFDAVEEDVRSRHGGRLLPLCDLFVAVGRCDPERGRQLLNELRRLAAKIPQHILSEERVLRSLLIARTDPDEARRWLTRPVAKFDEPHHPDRALSYAALGDHRAADRIVDHLSDSAYRTRLLSALAAHASGVSDDVMTRLDSEKSPQLALRLAVLVAPPDDGDGDARARALLSKALTGDAWNHALPVVAALAPDAVLRCRDVTFPSLGLDG